MTGLKTILAAQSCVFTLMLTISVAMVGALVLGEALNGCVGSGRARRAACHTADALFVFFTTIFVLFETLSYAQAIDQSRTRSRAWVPKPSAK